MTLGIGAHLRANAIRQHFMHFEGAGPAVVIVPGIVSPAILWSHVGEWLSSEYNCFILDVRGRGLSEAGEHLDYGVDACARDVLAFVEAANLNTPIVVGHSMGGRIALRALVISPGLLGGLVLVDPPTSGPGRRPYPVPKSRTLGLLRAALRGEALEALTTGIGRPWPEELRKLRAEWLVTCDERAVHATYDDFHGEDSFADLARSNEPISLICAGHGDVVSEADLEEMCKLRRDLVTTRIEGVGHQMQAEDFEAFKKTMGEILTRHRDILEGNRK